jgi:hypothetical protein
MINNVLLGLIESVLGKGEIKSKGNYAFKCYNPNCKSHSHPTKNIKLEVNLIPIKISHNKVENNWACWVCGVKGKTIHSLFRNLKLDISKYSELNSILGTTQTISKKDVLEQYDKLELPKEFKSFINLKKSDIVGRNALTYLLKNRNITFEDVIKHNIGYCEYGKYKDKIIIPSYSEEGILNYFVARTFIKDHPYPLDAPKTSKNIIGFESLINWDLPIIICEGPMDAIAIKRNAIPLFGKTIPEILEKKLISDNIEKVYLSLDEDAIKNTLFISEKLLSLNKKLYVIKTPSDPSEMGFVSFTKHIQNAKPFTFSDLIQLKMEL